MNFLEDVCKAGVLRVEAWDNGYTEQVKKMFGQGTSLSSEDQLDYYLYTFGAMQCAKLEYAFATLEDFLQFDEIRIIDYGCGQAIATLAYHDFLRQKGLAQKVKQIILIEPSITALRRANESCCQFYPDARIEVVAKDIAKLSSSIINCEEELPTLHLFSDILNLDTFEMSHLAIVVRGIVEKCGYSQFVCVSPYLGAEDPNQKRIDLFHKRLERNTSFHQEDFDPGEFLPGTDWTLSMRTFVIETDVHHEARKRKEQKRKEEEENNSWERWEKRLEECVTIGEYDLFVNVCPEAYHDLIIKARRKRSILERREKEEIARRTEWEKKLEYCITLEDYERLIETCPKPYNDLLVEANRKRKELESELTPRRTLLDRKEYWERELYTCNSLPDYKTFLKKCPSKYADLIHAAQAKIDEIERLGKEEKVGCRKWLFLAIIVILLPLILKWFFF